MTKREHLTDEDMAILRHVEEFKSITIEQCRRCFYNKQKYGVDMARKHLNKLVGYKRLKVARCDFSRQNVYYMTRKLTFHDLIAMDYYAMLKMSGADIIHFKREKEWMKDANKEGIESDAFCCFRVDNKFFFDIIEVNRTHFPDLEKYKELYNTSEPNDYCNDIIKSLGGKSIDITPRFILIDNVDHKEDPFINEEVEIIKLDFNLTNFSKVFMVIY